MKKIFLTFLALSFLVLAGCGKSEEKPLAATDRSAVAQPGSEPVAADDAQKKLMTFHKMPLPTNH